MGRSKHIAAAFIALLLSVLSVCNCFAYTQAQTADENAIESIDEITDETEAEYTLDDALTDALMTGMSWMTFVNNLDDDDLQYIVDNSDSEDLQQYFPGFTNMVSGLQSLISSREELGEYVGICSTDTSYDDENVYANLVLEYENKNVNVVVGLDRQMTQYTKFTFEPEYTFGEKMSNAALNLVAGMLTVFAVLILLMGVIYSFRYIHVIEEKLKNGSAKKKAQQASSGEDAPAAGTSAPAGAQAAQAMDDAQLAAVITAAVAAYEGTTTEGLVVRSIKRANDNKRRRS